MNFKKRVNGSWTDTPHYIHKTDTDILTTLPADIYADGNNATVGISGNTVQNGTPTPDNPVDVNGVGELTDNLFNPDDSEFGFVDSRGIVSSGSDNMRTVNFIPVLPNTTYSLNATGSRRIKAFKQNKTVVSDASYNDYGISLNTDNTFTTNSETYFIRFSFQPAELPIMFNEGSAVKPYEPYGYKIPISNGQQTTNIYLGNTQTVRAIKKLVLTGNENYGTSGGNTWLILGSSAVDCRGTSDGAICSHLPLVARSVFTTNTCAWDGGQIGDLLLNIENKNMSDLKSYIAAQYAAGTPVTVWYVLATPETATVNEPLMKIDDYADEVSGITIPTIAGANTLSVDTTLQPSEVSVNYKGWHPVSAVHERENGQWD